MAETQKYDYVYGYLNFSMRNACYLAAPFFNPQQLDLVQQIEQTFERHKVNCFSPRLQHGNKKVAIESVEHASEIFVENARAINTCTWMLAVVDWLMPPGQDLQVVNADGATLRVRVPDSGTVWEMGYAKALDKRIVIFTSRPPGERINIMLERSAIGVCYGFDALREYILTGPSALTSWKGKLQ